MNFGSDDPLADLLSDNSLDNDSFFENAAGTGSVRSTRAAPANLGKAKSKLEDLFGIKEETGPEKELSVQKTLATGNKTGISAPRTTMQQATQSLLENDDDDLGFDPKKPKSVLVKSNIFADLLGVSEQKRPATTAGITTSRREDGAKPIISRQSTDTTTDSTNLLRPKTAGGRRSSGTSTLANPDPLGLFGGSTGTTTTTKEKDYNPLVSASGMSTPKLKKRNTTADWLGLAAEPEVAQISQSQEYSTSKPSIININQSKLDILQRPVEIEKDEFILPPQKLQPQLETFANVSSLPTLVSESTTAQNILQLNTMQMETAHAMTAMKQQESHLTLAAQMRNQEQALQEMQSKQEAFLQQQERQFQILLQQQIQRQSQLEERIKMQQQRINGHIHLMMRQPAILSADLPDINVSTNSTAKGDLTLVPREVESTHKCVEQIELVQMEAEIRRLELEKLRLEELVANLKTNYEREIEMIEGSYKKQLLVSEEHLNAVETRLKRELEEQVDYYTDKLKTVETDRQKLRTEYETELSTTRQDHDDEMRKLRKSQEEDLDMLKEQHRRMLENIRQAKLLEFAAVHENGSYLDTLRLASTNLEHLSDGLENLRDDMQSKWETLNKDKERKLIERESRLEDAERRLKISEETMETERKRLMDLVSSLELQLNKLSKDSTEDNWQLRQKMCALDAEKISFEKEKEFVREQLARDEQRIKDLKEQELVERQRTMVELQEERARLVVERTKIETERKLQPAMDCDKQRLEVEAALKVAQDATRQADVERERYYKLQRQAEQQKRELVEKELMLSAKEDELEQELDVYRLAERKSQEAQQRARVSEHNFQTKIQLLQQRMQEVGEKEANLAQERTLLTEDRIALHNLKMKLGERKCMLCKMSESREEIGQLLSAQNNNIRANKATEQAVTEKGAVDMQYRNMLGQTNVVERLLDENIAESYRKMKENWHEAGLDDDSKELALHNFDAEIIGKGTGRL